MAADFLSKIIDTKKNEIVRAKKLIPEVQIHKEAFAHRGKRSFLNRLSRPGSGGINIIAEIKRASPSRGLLCPDLDPAEYASEYERGGAAALSVLTDATYFKGSFEDLKKAREATSLPVLRKDFIISSYQIYESSAIGADAVLLIARILSRKQLKEYLSLCDELSLDALVEIHSEKDLDTATFADAKLIGINNRNLSSFETDIEIAIRLVSNLSPDQIPVAASGIQGHEDIEKNLKAGISNFLIGESLVRADHPAAFLKRLILEAKNDR